MAKLAIVTDFDGTLMEQDVGNILMRRRGINDIPEVAEANRRFLSKEIGSWSWIQTAYPMLAAKQREVDEVIAQTHFREGAERFLTFCSQEGLPVTILSDGMLYYIQQILKANGVQVDRVISNPIVYDEKGAFSFGVQNDNDACKWCGCCKADVVRRMKQEGWNIIYIGDGSSDFYGSGFADWIFARSSLARYLQEEGTEFYPFRTFSDVLGVVEASLEAFKQGTADKRVNRLPAACSFPNS